MCGAVSEHRLATRVRFVDADGRVIDDGLALNFAAPRSFTGEDVVELHGHGGPVVMDLLLRAAIAAGARIARPGEFTERAFLNGKLDLAQADAVADLIASRSEAAARSALRSLSGEFSSRVNEIAGYALDLRVFVEAAIDFPEDEVDFLSDGRVSARLERLIGMLDALLNTATQGALLNEGITLVLAGRPNVGKSSLMNRLLGYERAIVSEIAGTTRDVLAESIDLNGVPIRVVDTAGLRLAGDSIEQEGIRRARKEIDDAQQVVLVVDDRAPETAAEVIAEQRLPTDRLTVAANKIDLSGGSAGERSATGPTMFGVSALTGNGVESLKRRILALAGHRDDAGVFSARRRHLEALRAAGEYLRHGAAALREAGAGELLADDLRRAHDHLGDIVGTTTSDALLGEIFSRFCIGK
jgi:tRNA modification GTPase